VGKPEASRVYERLPPSGAACIGVQDAHDGAARPSRNRYASFLIRYQAGTVRTLPIVSPYALALRAQPPRNGECREAVLRALGTDPFLTARLLKDANSMFFNTSHREILTLEGAIAHLGLEHALKLLGRPQAEEKRLASEGFGKFWAHSIAVSVAAQEIAQLRSVAGIGPDTARLLGLIHDIGYLIEARFDPGLASNPDLLPVESIGRDRARLGAALAAAWSLPKCVQWAFGDPSASGRGSSGSSRAIAALIALAGTAARGNRYRATYDAWALKVLDLQMRDLTSVAQTACHHYQEALHVVGLLSVTRTLAPAQGG
jgi:HDOD domain-containing protein